MLVPLDAALREALQLTAFQGQAAIALYVLGLAVGHCYYFFEDVYPRLTDGRRPLGTPRVLTALFGGNRSRSRRGGLRRGPRKKRGFARLARVWRMRFGAGPGAGGRMREHNRLGLLKQVPI